MLASSLDVVVTCDVSKCLCIGKHIVHYMYVCPGSSVLRQRLLACAVLLNPSELASLQQPYIQTSTRIDLLKLQDLTYHDHTLVYDNGPLGCWSITCPFASCRSLSRDCRLIVATALRSCLSEQVGYKPASICKIVII